MGSAHPNQSISDASVMFPPPIFSSRSEQWDEFILEHHRQPTFELPAQSFLMYGVIVKLDGPSKLEVKCDGITNRRTWTRGDVSVAPATHLEDMTTPANRDKQLVELLAQIKSINHPVIVAGDMNTSTHDAAPLSVTRALKQRFGSGRWWAEEGVSEALRKATPFGWAYDISRGLIGFARGADDPTVRSIPLIGKNPEAAFFTTLEKFRFTDGTAFDFRGTSARTSNGQAGNIADSNERGGKGFVPTSELGRTYGPIGKYKLDWFFVRPFSLRDPHDTRQSYRFAPYFGRTLKELNQSIPERISDHCPITVDLPFGEPPAP